MAEWNDEWRTERWRAEAHEWISMVLDSHALRQTGRAEQGRVRLCSTRIMVPTDHGRLYFKANNPGQFAEGTVASTAAGVAPDRLVMPLAVEPLRGWMISPDYGETLVSVAATDDQWWSRILRDFARLQRELAPFGDILFDAGLLQLDPAWLPGYVDGQVMLHASMPPEHPLHLPARDAEYLDGRLGEIGEMCDFLAAGPVPLTLVHNDLQRGNAFLPVTPDQPLRFTDLGGAYWAHPFSSLGAPIRVMCEELRATPANPRVSRVVTHYLDQWRDFGTAEELRPYVEPALRVGTMQSHGMWMRILAGASEADVQRHAHRVLRPLAELAEPVFG